MIELLVVIAIIGILAALLFPVLSKTRGKADKVVCVNNLRQLMIATTSYAGDHRDALAYPGFNNTETLDCWLYAKGIPGLVGDASPAAIEQQFEFVKRGQLYRYYENLKLLECPRDAAGRLDQQQENWYTQRRLKVTSYVMNGAAQKCSRINTNMPPMAQYRSDGILFVEGNERRQGRGFWAGASEPSRYISQRHDPKEFKGGKSADTGGGSVVAHFDGSAGFIKYAEWVELAGAEGQRGADLPAGAVPNRVWCYPNKRGGAAE